jgi:flagellar protein FliT
VKAQGVLPAYERALELTRGMLDAAQKGDWDRLVELEKERSVHVDRIRDLDPDPSREESARERKREIVLAMLQTDERIQVLTQDWMHELREVLSSISAEQRLARTYGP